MKVVVFLLAFAVIGALPAAYAEIVQHQNFDREFLGLTEDGKKAIYQDKIYTYNRIQDNQGDWIDYILNEDANIIQVESAQGSLVFSKPNCAITFYNDQRITPQSIPEIYSDSYTVKRSTNGSGVWQKVNQINNAPCETAVLASSDGVQIIANKSATNVGQFSLKYIKRVGEDWKTQLEPTNWSSLTDQQFGVTQVLEIPRFIAFGNNSNVDLANYNNTLFDREFLGNHKGKLIGFKNSVNFDFGLGWDYVESVRVYYFGGNTAKLAINYLHNAPIILPNQTLIIDPVITVNGSNTAIQLSRQQTGAGTTCGTGSTYSRASAFALGTDVSSSNTWCRWTTLEIPLTSIPNNADITDVDFQGKVTSSGTATAKGCDYVDYGTTDPDSDSDATVYSNAFTNSAYVTNDTQCTTKSAGQTWTVDLGTNADADVEAVLTTTDRFTLAMRYNPAEREASEINRTYNSAYSGIVVTYQIPLNPPSGFACSSDGDEVLCTWTPPSPASEVETYYIGRSLDNSTWPAGNKTSTGNVTSATLYTFRANQLYYLNVTAGNSGFNSTADYTNVTTDDYPNAPGTSDTEGSSDTSIIIRWLTPTNDGNDAINGYTIRYENQTAPSGWQTLVANTTTTTTNYNHTGLHGGHDYIYQVAAGNGVGFGLFSGNMTAAPFEAPNGTVSLTTGNIGDTIQINATVTMTAGSPDPTVTQLEILRDNVVVETRSENTVISPGDSDTLDPAWYQVLDDSSHDYAVRITATNGTVSASWVSTVNATITREYNPSYNPSITDPATLGDVNATVSRFSSQDGVQLKVNRINVASGETWTLNCIAQTNAEAFSTRNQSMSWPGTWRNYSSIGYGNTTWTGFSGDHAYITCVNPPSIIFTTTSFTNSSVALFGIQIFDESYGSMLGVPVSVFFLVLVAGMANKRTAPTFIIVILGMAGVLATLLFFTLDPLVWGLALVTGLLGALVNQKVF